MMKTTLRTILLQLVLICCMVGSLFAQTTNDNIGALAGAIDVSSTGAAQYTIPIDCPAGLGGMQPSLSITYNSQAGDGFLGMGWNLSGLSAISRIPTQSYTGYLQDFSYIAEDRYALDGNPLIRLSGSQGEMNSVYETEVETYQNIKVPYGIYEGHIPSGPESFHVTTKDGRTIEYGFTANAHFIPNADKGKKAPYMWMVSSISDRNGNFIKYKYTKKNNRPYISKISYGNDFTSDVTDIVFTLSDRNGAHVSYAGGRAVYNDSYCSKIEVKRGEEVLHSYSFGYNIDSHTNIPFLSTIQKSYGDGSEVPATTINWGSHSMEMSQDNIYVSPLYSPERKNCRFTACDINGDGMQDLFTYESALKAKSETGLSYIAGVSDCTSSCRKVTGIIDGMGKNTQIGYRSLSTGKHSDGSVFYSKVKPQSWASDYNYTHLNVPLICVENIQTTVWQETLSHMEYS